jgi:hypothetical protein
MGAYLYPLSLAEIWPLPKRVPRIHSTVAWSILGALVLTAAWYLANMRSTQ